MLNRHRLHIDYEIISRVNLLVSMVSQGVVRKGTQCQASGFKNRTRNYFGCPRNIVSGSDSNDAPLRIWHLPSVPQYSPCVRLSKYLLLELFLYVLYHYAHFLYRCFQFFGGAAELLSPVPNLVVFMNV